MCIQVSEAGNNFMCHLQDHSCTFFRQDLSQAWDSMFRPWDSPWILPDHCWLIAHVTMPGILIWALELKLRSPCSQRKHFIGCTTPHSLISPPCPEFSVLSVFFNTEATPEAWVFDWHIIFYFTNVIVRKISILQ